MSHKAFCLLMAIALVPGLLPAQAAPAVTATIPNGRQITPLGDWISVAPFPFGFTLRRDGQQLIAPSLGFPFALNVIDRPAAADRKVTQIPRGFLSVPGVEVYAGVAYSPDGKLLYVATGDSGAVDVLATTGWRRVAWINLNGASQGHVYEESFAGSLVLSNDGRRLYVIDQANWRVVVIDTTTNAKIASLATGVNPIAVCLSPDGSRLYVANSGLFEYKTIPGADNDDRLHSELHFPPFGYPSSAARNGATVEGRQIPGLGDVNNPRGSSLWTYDVSDPKRARHVASLRLGTAIASASDHVIGGAAPSALAANEHAVYVALAHDDAVAIIDADGRALQKQIPLSPFTGREFENREGVPLRGVMPSGLALNANRLYVTEAGINALAVIDTAGGRVLGHLPVGWSPSAVLVSPDGGRKRPGDGYPLLESYVADNDLALGQIVDALSRSSIWKDTAVFVTEDDPQSGVDHVDAHRSILLVMSPYVRNGFISHRHSSMGSIQRTIYELLGVGPLNLEDALASDLSDMFTTEPNLAPYTALPTDTRVFDPARARIARPKSAKEKADLADIDDSQKIRKTFRKGPQSDKSTTVTHQQ